MRLLRRSDLWLPPLLLMGVIFFLSAQPHLNSGLGTFDTVLRKCAHFGAYALLCFLWWRAFRATESPTRAALLAFVLTSAYAVTDEWHQSYVNGRHASLVDVAIDSSAAALVAARLAGRTRARA